jgi:glycosyltransferase involved in cell wall biosynthesis
MTSVLVAILTSGKLEKLIRCIESVLPQTDEIVVVCNTLDISYVEQARVAARAYNLEFIVTESNGTPAKGKNSVLEIFRSRSQFKYYMQVDGDDYLVPGALSKIDTIVQQNPNVDVIGLQDGCLIYNGTTTTGKKFISEYLANANGEHGLRLMELGKFLAATLQESRMLLYSEKVVNTFNFDETFVGLEDVVGAYKLYYDPNIKFILTTEDLYVYDLEENGNFYEFLNNSNGIEKVFQALKAIVNESSIQK